METPPSMRTALVNRSWQYLFENFHKFNEFNKIKVALEIIKRDMPTKLEGAVGGDTKIFVVRDKKEIVGNPAQALSRPLPIQQ